VRTATRCWDPTYDQASLQLGYPALNQNHALCWAMMFERTNTLPSGYLTVRHGKSPFLMGKPSISMGI
jgi:hypothetical protein